MWQSADPILGKYLPDSRKPVRMSPPTLEGQWQTKFELAGVGGVYNPLNLGLYSYGHLNPVRYTDPDGKETQVIITKDYLVEFKVPFTDYKVKLGQYGSHAAVRVDNPRGEPTLYDPAGSYTPREGGEPARGSGDFLTGKSADLETRSGQRAMCSALTIRPAA